jgi:hypothetical protein
MLESTGLFVFVFSSVHGRPNFIVFFPGRGFTDLFQSIHCVERAYDTHILVRIKYSIFFI